MKKGNILLLALGIVILVLVGSTLTTYNSLVAKDERVATNWNRLQQQYQRRAELIPHLLESVKGHHADKQNTLCEVETAQAKAAQCTLKADKLTPESVKQFSDAQEELSKALSKLLQALKEDCPNLNADELFADMQTQLEETSSSIDECRQRYNQGVNSYNCNVHHFPANLVAPLFGFDKKTAFNE